MATANDIKQPALLTKPEQDLIIQALEALAKGQERRANAAHNQHDNELKEVHEKKQQQTTTLIYKLRNHNLGFQ